MRTRLATVTLPIGFPPRMCLQHKMFESQNPGLWYTPDRYQTFSTLADAVFSVLDFPTAARKWGGSVLALEALIDKVAPPPESPEERAARLQVCGCSRTFVCLPCVCPCA